MATIHIPTDLRFKNFLELSVTVEWDMSNIIEYRNGELRDDIYYRVYTSLDDASYTLAKETRHKYAVLPLQTEPFFIKVTSFCAEWGESVACDPIKIEVTMGQVSSRDATINWGSISKKGSKISDLDVPSYRGHANELLQVTADQRRVQWLPITWSDSAHLHDDRYYTKSGADEHFYDKQESDALLAQKSFVHEHPYQLLAQKGMSNGYCELDPQAKIPANRVPDFLLGQVVFKGTWNAELNLPDVGSPADNKGYYYVTVVGGTQFGKEFTVGDWIISDGAVWDKVDNTDAVPTVFGRIGNIVAGVSDYAAFYSQLGHTHIKSEVGLHNVDNTSDANKPVSAATQVALDLKADLESPTFTGTVSGISKAMVGLGNADNTSDINKPISVAQQAAIDLKADIHNPAFTGTVTGVSKGMVGLGNVDNVADLNKPISVATQTALDLKAPINSPAFTGVVSGVTKTMVGLSNVDNTSDADKPISSATQAALNTKSNDGHDHAAISGNAATSTRAASAALADNADLLDGFHGSTSVAGNTYVLRDGNGYTYHNYINTVADVDSAAGYAFAMRNSSDNFLRWRTAGYVRQDIGAAPLSHDHTAISGSSGSCTGNSATATYATSSGNSDTLDGLHSSAFAPASHDHAGISGSSGSCTGNAATATYATSAGNADTLDGNHSSAFAPVSHDHGSISGSSGSCTGNAATATYAVSAGSAGTCTGNAATATSAASCSGNSATATTAYQIWNDSSNMVFHWSGQSGQPPWLWGSSDGIHAYVYNPSNFSVNYANSAGTVDWSNVSGRPSAVSAFTNDSGYVTSAGSVNYANSAGAVSWSNVSGRPSAVSAFTNDSGYVTASGSVNYATSAGSAGSCTGNAATATTAASCSGTSVYATTAYNLWNDSNSMVFHWNGQGGQPTWLWGGTDGVNMYVYNPNNFNVNYANSAGSVAWIGVQGRPTALSSFTNDSGYVTSSGSITGSSGSCTGNAATATYATSAGSAGSCTGNAATATYATSADLANVAEVGRKIRTAAPASPVNGDIWVVA